MTIASLLNRPGGERELSAFIFDHAMAHRNYYQVMAPLHGWSVLPYFIDPGPERTNRRSRRPLATEPSTGA